MGETIIEAYLQKCISEKMILAMDKEKADAVLLSIGGHFSKASAPINFDSTIAYSYSSVKNDLEGGKMISYKSNRRDCGDYNA